MKFTPSPFHRRALALAIGTIIGVTSQATLGADTAESLGRAYADSLQDQVEVFVRLQTPSVSELNAAAIAATGKYASRDAQIQQAQRVDAEQAAFRDTLAGLGATELSTQRIGANGFRVSIEAGEVDSLKSMPGVRSVGRVETHEALNVTSVPWTGATAVNATGFSGEGVSIGVIDTGIDYTHANFGGPGTVAAYTGNNKNVVEPGTFPTAKVVGGFDFAGPTYNANVAGSVPAPDPDPLDGNGHGSHVSGTAAGFGVPGIIGAGAAPQARLYALKVFSDAAGSTNLTSLAIEWAMDPNADGDMSDHLDVINMSLGSNFGEPADPSAISSENAVAAGIIVVSSAGNSGAIPYVTGAPAVADAAISVAANTPGGRNFATLNIDAPAAIAGAKFNEEGTSPRTVASVAPLTDTVVEATPLDACVALTNAAAVNGNIVLLQRGTCTFQVKMANALAAGARAAIAFNNAPGDPIVMGAVTALIPGVMVSLADGTAIAGQATTDAASPVTATFGFGPDPTKQDRIASFSSRGPGSGGTGFKPDIAAPGVGIVSTGVGTGNGSAPNQGTSMASPHVAGAAALLFQKFGQSPRGIKALLQNSTVNVNPSNAADTSLARNGVGSMRVNRAAALTSFASPGGVSFGRVNPAQTTNVLEKVVVENLKNAARTFTVTHVPRATYPGVTVTCPATFSVAANRTRTVQLKLQLNPVVTAAAGVFDNGSRSQTEVDGWCVFSDGTDSLRVGYLAAVDAASNLLASDGQMHFGLKIANRGPAVGFAEGFTWVGSGGTGADNTYGSIAHLGVRRGDPAFFGGDQVVEFGISVDRTWDHISNLAVDLFLDLDRNGTDDVRLAARDWTAFQSTGVLGTYVTAQFIVGNGGFLDWIVGGWDFNDRVVVLPFTTTASGGLVPNSFNYRLVTQDRQGNTDVQTGSIDLANEVVPDLNSFGLAGGDSANVSVSTSGNMLWLYPNNHDWLQDQKVWAEAGP